MLGDTLLFGVNNSLMQSLVQGSGTALQMTSAMFRRQLEQLPAFRRKLDLYAFVLQGQLALTAACLRFHSLDLRLARWLLMAHDRSGSGSIDLTQELLAEMLGVRRVGVTNAAGRLQKLKILSYSRGKITILDRAGLEQASCACYRASEALYEDALGYTG
ncbi:MAG: Crp/Fnr family transcriptional regulator [Gammaproteobacteria bacterium]|nr:Crp/Fnr family transcriptional regulator [Gammaproteobacteria bacterium]